MSQDSSHWNLTWTVGGLGITLAGLYLLRRSRTRAWIDLGRLPHIRNQNLNGKVVVVTGANTGIGFEAAKEFSRRGAATVILACRDIKRGSEAATRIRDATGNSHVECHSLNLASLKSIRSFANEFNSQYEKLDILVCNAGVWIPMERGEKTEDGFEMHFGVNHLGHFLLTNLLMEKLTAAKGKVIAVSSQLMTNGKINMEDEDFVYQGRKADKIPDPKQRSFAPTGYSDTKLMNALFAKSLAQKFVDIEAYSVCPGWCNTELARYLNMSVFKKFAIMAPAFFFMRGAAQGSHNIVYLALEDGVLLTNGGFYRDGKLVEKENDKLNSMEDVGEKLWKLSEKLAGIDN